MALTIRPALSIEVFLMIALASTIFRQRLTGRAAPGRCLPFGRFRFPLCSVVRSFGEVRSFPPRVGKKTLAGLSRPCQNLGNDPGRYWRLLRLRRSLCLFTFALLLFPGCRQQEQAEIAPQRPSKDRTTEKTGRWQVSAINGLNMRELPTGESPKMTTLPTGAIVTMREVTREAETIGGESGPWARVEFEDRTGWVFKPYLREWPANCMQIQTFPADFQEGCLGCTENDDRCSIRGVVLRKGGTFWSSGATDCHGIGWRTAGSWVTTGKQIELTGTFTHEPQSETDDGITEAKERFKKVYGKEALAYPIRGRISRSGDGTYQFVLYGQDPNPVPGFKASSHGSAESATVACITRVPKTGN